MLEASYGFGRDGTCLDMQSHGKLAQSNLEFCMLRKSSYNSYHSHMVHIFCPAFCEDLRIS